MKKWVNLVCNARHEKRVLVDFPEDMEDHHIDETIAEIQTLTDIEEYTLDPESWEEVDAEDIELDNVTEEEALMVNVPDFTVTLDEDGELEVVLGEGD